MRPSANAVDQSELILSDKSVPRPLVCRRCAHEWHPRKGRTPKCCPFCLSAYWNVPFKRFTSQKDIKAAQAKIRERVTKRQQERARKALRNRLERSARKLGPESASIIKDLFPSDSPIDPRVVPTSMRIIREMTKSGMPPPPKFDEDE